MTSTPIAPLRRSILVPWAQEAAFRRFTAEIGTWWPLRSHSVGGERSETVIFEGRVGGRLYERIRGGEESTWGTVTAWEPPARVVFTWHPGRAAELEQEIELRFIPQGGGTRLELTHSGWEKLGALGPKARRGYRIGWAYVLRLYADRKSSPVVWGLDGLMWALQPLQRRMARRAQAMSESGSAAR
ncbi:MAG: ATPase [Planctomycetota bacterium]|nr:MAG: ATPase [Planctomycetota bacterium]